MEFANDPIARRIREAAGRGTLSHALLFSGSGDRIAAAQYAAAAMECQGGGQKPCGTCPACRKVFSGIHPDVITVRDEAHKNLSVDTVRQIRADAYIRPNEGARKVYIFPDCTILTEQDQNVLLKIVEEGPPYAAFLFCAENSSVVLQTLRSRCVELKLHPAVTVEKESSEAGVELCRLLAAGKRGTVTELMVRLEKKRLDRDGLAAMLDQARTLLAAALLGCERKQATKALPRLVMGYDEYRPYTYTDEDGHSAGIDVEIATEACRRLGRQPVFLRINWSMRDTCLKNRTVDCLWCSYSMNGREEDYDWAGPYVLGRQVVAVRTSSDIYTLADLADKTLVVQSTTKPEELFLDAAANGLPQLRAVYSLQDRDLIYTTLIKGYADALAAHESAIRQFMKDYSVEYRILAEPLMQADLGVAFAKDRADDLPQRLTETFREMLADGTTREIVSRYLDEPDHYLEGMGGSSDD